jgi:hypothetical protein
MLALLVSLNPLTSWLSYSVLQGIGIVRSCLFSSTTMPAVLPTELLRPIFTHIRNEGNPLLIPLCQACRIFQQEASVLLYENIDTSSWVMPFEWASIMFGRQKITWESYSRKRFVKLLNTLTDNLSLAALVKSLSLEFRGWEIAHPNEQMNALGGPYLIQYLPSLQACLPNLVNLKHFRFRTDPIPHFVKPSKLCSVFISCNFQLETFAWLSDADNLYFIDFLTRQKMLRSLRVSTFSQTGLRDGGPSFPVPHLNSVSILKGGYLTCLALLPACRQGLKTLEYFGAELSVPLEIFSVDRGIMTQTADGIKEALSNIEILHWRNESLGTEAEFSAVIHFCTNLKTLCISGLNVRSSHIVFLAMYSKAERAPGEKSRLLFCTRHGGGIPSSHVQPKGVFGNCVGPEQGRYLGKLQVGCPWTD